MKIHNPLAMYLGLRSIHIPTQGLSPVVQRVGWKLQLERLLTW